MCAWRESVGVISTRLALVRRGIRVTKDLFGGRSMHGCSSSSELMSKRILK
ncbi:hypothetical protein HanPI659440_Chr06g0225131 [Helianthus annuus]|nr:hypothetical protein HanPI659440_Chr06g0225131 [Helianthus annuus]